MIQETPPVSGDLFIERIRVHQATHQKSPAVITFCFLQASVGRKQNWRSKASFEGLPTGRLATRHRVVQR